MTCPAATRFDPPGVGTRVLCGVLKNANDEQRRGLGVGGVTFDERSDVSVILAHCAGDGPGGCPRSYGGCPVWRKQRDAEMERKLFDQGRRGTAAEVV